MTLGTLAGSLRKEQGMADKDTVALIKKHDEERADAFMRHVREIGLAAGLTFLVEDYRRVAELYTTAQLRGGKALQTECRNTASKLALLARGVEQAERTAVPAPAAATNEIAPLQQAPHLNAGLDEAVHRFGPATDSSGKCTMAVDRGNGLEQCGRYASHPAHRMTSPPPAGSPEGLEALVSDRAGESGEPQPVFKRHLAMADNTARCGEQRPTHITRVESQVGCPACLAAIASETYPAGGAIALAAELAAAESMTVDSSVGPDLTGGAFTEAVLAAREDANAMIANIAGYTLSDPAPIPAPQRVGDRCPDCGATADEPSVCGDDWHGRPIPATGAIPTLSDPAAIPGPRITWDDLTNAMGAPLEANGLPEHLSHSQLDTLRECGTKYLLQRSEVLGVVQVPQWALVGGKAFHAAVEWFERLVETNHTSAGVPPISVQLEAAGGIGEVWRRVFGQTITDEAVANPRVPVDQWRGARKGAEGYTWWLVEGEAMLQKYITMRMSELERGATRRVRMVGEAPMLEHESSMDVGGVEFKVVLDQVWEITGEHGPMRPGDLLIDDLKSGRTLPVETGQLEEYALWLVRQLPAEMLTGGNPPAIWGRFYDARKGAYTEPVDLLERADWRRFSYEVAAADRRKRAGIFDPQPSSFCGGCSVKHACPVFATLAPGA